jgi:hypothetical protein
MTQHLQSCKQQLPLSASNKASFTVSLSDTKSCEGYLLNTRNQKQYRSYDNVAVKWMGNHTRWSTKQASFHLHTDSATMIARYETSEATQSASFKRRLSKGHYLCPIAGCSSTFTRKFNMQGHVRSHMRTKPFRCDKPDCDKSFARSYDRNRHVKLHDHVKAHKCKYCSQAFARPDALSRHVERKCRDRSDESLHKTERESDTPSLQLKSNMPVAEVISSNFVDKQTTAEGPMTLVILEDLDGAVSLKAERPYPIEEGIIAITKPEHCPEAKISVIEGTQNSDSELQHIFCSMPACHHPCRAVLQRHKTSPVDSNKEVPETCFQMRLTQSPIFNKSATQNTRTPLWKRRLTTTRWAHQVSQSLACPCMSETAMLVCSDTKISDDQDDLDISEFITMDPATSSNIEMETLYRDLVTPLLTGDQDTSTVASSVGNSSQYISPNLDKCEIFTSINRPWPRFTPVPRLVSTISAPPKGVKAATSAAAAIPPNNCEKTSRLARKAPRPPISHSAKVIALVKAECLRCTLFVAQKKSQEAFHSRVE